MTVKQTLSHLSTQSKVILKRKNGPWAGKTNVGAEEKETVGGNGPGLPGRYRKEPGPCTRPHPGHTAHERKRKSDCVPLLIGGSAGR